MSDVSKRGFGRRRIALAALGLAAFVRAALVTAVALLGVLGATGCMISTQDGERTHVNSPAPVQMAFHFDSGFNRMLLWGRTLLLLSVAGALWRKGAGKGTAVHAALLAVAVLVGAAVWHWQGWSRLSGYRIEVQPDQLHVVLPGEPAFALPWERIEGLYVEGQSNDIRIADGSGQALTEITRWEHVSIVLTDGGTRALDLRPLSTEQRGTLWRAIVRKAQLEAMDGRTRQVLLPAPR